MIHLKAILLSALLCVVATGAAPAARAASVNSGHVQLELVPAAAAVAPGKTIYVALRQKIAPGWHTYWRNPGDAGEPPKLGWTLPPGWQAGDPVWPLPKRLQVGPLVDYGYEGEVYLPIPLTAPAGASGSAPLKAAVTVLVCKDICIPEEATLQLDLPVSPGAPASVSDAKVAAALAAAPRQAPLKAALARDGSLLKVSVAGAPLKGVSAAGAYFFPYDSTAINHAKPQSVEQGPDGLTLSLEPGYAFQKPQPPKELKGVLAVAGQAYEIDAAEGPPAAGAAGLGAPAPPPQASGGLNLPLALGFAFLGGMILNLMPCVFPVLAMKAAALAGHSQQPGEARAQGLAYGAGVIGTFLALAGGLIAARAAGDAIGWGYQLQTPLVTAALTLVMLLVALNLSGVFEVGASAQGAGSHLASRGGLVGAFFTGALAVVVAAPCTAPFMAAAIGYAFAQPTAVTLGVFVALGLGLAVPFVALSFAPALIRLMPRPGGWMDVLRRVLAFPMYGAAAWLAWVFASQAGHFGLARLLAAALAVAFGAWLYGLGQRASGAGGLWRLAAAPAIAAAALLLYPVRAPEPITAARPASAASLASTPFSPEKLAELRGQGHPVFVDFTADWCITCKVNEQVALSRPAVAKAFADAGAVYMVADWTQRDPVIARALAEHGRVGVPLYVVYGARSGKAVILPQLLTEDAVLAALHEAAAS
jgi:thiol:disulfide interchange protein DsbD